jgi:signal transduction histidine kinase
VRLGQTLALAPAELDLGDTCRLAIEDLAELAGSDRVRFEIPGTAIGWWDGERLAQVVSNLLENALVHGAADQPVTVRVEGSPGGVELEVRNGGFIPPAVQATLFDPRTDPATRRREGSSGLGLGLFLSREIVLAHGGTIAVNSSPDSGTSAIVFLPRSLP